MFRSSEIYSGQGENLNVRSIAQGFGSLLDKRKEGEENIGQGQHLRFQNRSDSMTIQTGSWVPPAPGRQSPVKASQGGFLSKAKKSSEDRLLSSEPSQFILNGHCTYLLVEASGS